jgi:hypothetical protein
LQRGSVLLVDHRGAPFVQAAHLSARAWDVKGCAGARRIRKVDN